MTARSGVDGGSSRWENEFRLWGRRQGAANSGTEAAGAPRSYRAGYCFKPIVVLDQVWFLDADSQIEIAASGLFFVFSTVPGDKFPLVVIANQNIREPTVGGFSRLISPLYDRGVHVVHYCDVTMDNDRKRIQFVGQTFILIRSEARPHSR